MENKNSDLLELSGDLEAILKLRSFPIGMRLFETV